LSIIFNKTCIWYAIIDAEGDKKSQKIISELENIDDDCEEKDISFVKTSDEGIQKEYDLPSLPALVFYRNKFRQIYTGNINVVRNAYEDCIVIYLSKVENMCITFIVCLLLRNLIILYHSEEVHNDGIWCDLLNLMD
jgi:hypothetical protein